MKPLFYKMTTLGCKVNEYESRYYMEQLESLGIQQADAGQPADVVLINTCTVTNTAARKSRQKIRRARKENPGALCVVVGCYAQTMEEDARKELEADLLIGAAGKNQIRQLVADALAHRHKPCSVPSALEIQDFESMPIGHFEGQHRAYLKIQDGCNQYCAYCQIPLARGPERSQIPAEAVETACRLAKGGHQEIVLTGIHTGRYSFRSVNLTGLLKMLLEKVPENVDFRISSIEITEVSDELLDLMEKNRRILHHLHIPVQAGSNATLARMKRPYTVEMFAERLAEIRRRIPDISISTDVITGFVQESDEEFETTRQTLEQLGFSFLHVFPYSRRKGTAADGMSGFVDPQTVKKRTDVLLALSRRLRLQDMKRFDTLTVLVEREGTQPGTWSGYSEQYHPVLIHADSPVSGRVHVQVTGIENGVYNASIISEDNCHATFENV